MFFIADLHAITEKYEPRALAGTTLTTAALYLVMSVPLGYLSRYLEKRWGAK